MDQQPVKHHRANSRSAFSLLELLVVLVVLGAILYFAFPNIIQVRSDSEKSLAKARAETLNLAAATYFQAVGSNAASSNWSGKDSAARYLLLRSYISFAPSTLSEFMPSSDYNVIFDNSAPHKVKAQLLGPTAGGSTNLTTITY